MYFSNQIRKQQRKIILNDGVSLVHSLGMNICKKILENDLAW